MGCPGAGYPLPWSVSDVAARHDRQRRRPRRISPFARDLTEFVRGVRSVDTGGRTFAGSGRGGDLQDHDDWMESCFPNSEHLLDVPRLRELWEAFRGLPPPPSAEVMTHGDLISGNVLVYRGRLADILDVGGLVPADRATRSGRRRHLLQDAPRQSFRHELHRGDIEWERGKVWAFQQSMDGSGQVLRRQQPSPESDGCTQAGPHPGQHINVVPRVSPGPACATRCPGCGWWTGRVDCRARAVAAISLSDRRVFSRVVTQVPTGGCGIRGIHTWYPLSAEEGWSEDR